MADEFVPTTEQVRYAYATRMAPVRDGERYAEFDRWLAAHDAETREQALAPIRDEVERLRTMFGDCHCDKNPETTNGPEEDCPQHGRPVAEVWGLVKRAEDGWDHARAEVDRLCAEVRLAKASARSAGLALGARLDHPHGGFPEGTWLAEQFDAASPSPAWDEDSARCCTGDASQRDGHHKSCRYVHGDLRPDPDDRETAARAWDEGYADYLEGPAEMANPYRAAEGGADRG